VFYAYFDESGDAGYVKSPTRTFTLSCLLVHDSQWLAALDKCIAFRRYLKAQFGVPVRAELKAAWLIHNQRDIKAANLPFQARMSVYRAALRFQRKTKLFRAFSVLVDKEKVASPSKVDPRANAWEFAIQRLERFGSANKENIHVVPDDGHSEFIRKTLRAMRRFSNVPSAYGQGTLDRKAKNILEDPSDRKSRESHFIQLCDLNAYASVRKVFPTKNFGGEFWDELGDMRLAEVNKLKPGQPRGIVIWPA
jgi:hypothetical protein